MTRTRLAGVCLIGLALLVVITVGGYLFGWWLRADVKDREVSIANHNKGVQTAWSDEALENMAEIEILGHSPNGSAAVAALKNRTCDLIGRLTDNYRNDDRIVVFWERECI